MTIRLATLSTLVGAAAMASAMMASSAFAAPSGIVTITSKAGESQTWVGAPTTCYLVNGNLGAPGDKIVNDTSHAIRVFTLGGCVGDTYVNVGAGDTITDLGVIGSFETFGM